MLPSLRSSYAWRLTARHKLTGVSLPSVALERADERQDMKKDSWVRTGTRPSHPGVCPITWAGTDHSDMENSQPSPVFLTYSEASAHKTLYKIGNPQVSYKTHLCRICFSTLIPSGFCAVISSTGDLWTINTKKRNNLKYLLIPIPTVGVSVAGEGKRKRLCRQRGGTLQAPPGRPRTSISRCESRGFREGRGPLTSQPSSWLWQQHSMSAQGEQAPLLSHRVSEHPNHRITKHGRRREVRTERPPGIIWLLQSNLPTQQSHPHLEGQVHSLHTHWETGRITRRGALCNGRSDKKPHEAKK